MKKQRLKLSLNKVRVSKINNLNTILGGGTDSEPPHTNAHSCRLRETCEHSYCATTTTATDTTDGEATGFNNGTRTTN